MTRPSASFAGILALAATLAACSHRPPSASPAGHLPPESAAQSDHAIPPWLPESPSLAPKARESIDETYSVEVNQVPVRDLLFALARDAGINIDIHPQVGGMITLIAKRQSVPEILRRIARQTELRIEHDGQAWTVQPDSPHLKNYRIDYVNMTRQVSGAISTSTQIAGATPSAAPAPAGAAASNGNLSNTRIDIATRNTFWESLEKNIKELLRETDKLLPEGSSETEVEQTASQLASGPFQSIPGRGNSRNTHTQPTPQITYGPSSSQAQGNTLIRRNTFREAASVIINQETGVVSVRATSQQHARIAEFIDQVRTAAHRQVLIEATIVSVELSDGYKQGIDWSRLRSDQSGYSLTRPNSGNALDNDGGAFSLALRNNKHPLGLVAAIDLLQSFGTTKVLSSPRLSVLNNQTALLKVVENIVYFSVKADTTNTANVGSTTVVSTTPQSVSVGLVMAVTPQIGESRDIILNIRPSISSVSDWKQDPNPNNKVPNYVPQIKTREIESMMRIASGEIALLGGLMEDGIDYQTGRLPGLGDIPLLGEAVTRRDNARRKSELVIFLRPVVIDDASLHGDYATFAGQLPGKRFFKADATHQPFNTGGQ